MKILLVEDDPALARVVALGLRKEGIEVENALSGETALKMAVAGKYDVIILDLMLPGKSGAEVCSHLRAAHNQTPIIALTALADLETKIKLFNLGVDDYLTKPFDFKELFARIKAVLRKHNIEFENELKYHDIKLDRKKHQVTRRDQKIELRDKEIRMLEYFIMHPEQVLTREMILSYVWGPNVERFTNVVDVHVHYLRDKIDKPYGTRLLKTVNNLGYKISKD